MNADFTGAHFDRTSFHGSIDLRGAKFSLEEGKVFDESKIKFSRDRTDAGFETKTLITESQYLAYFKSYARELFYISPDPIETNAEEALAISI